MCWGRPRRWWPLGGWRSGFLLGAPPPRPCNGPLSPCPAEEIRRAVCPRLPGRPSADGVESRCFPLRKTGPAANKVLGRQHAFLCSADLIRWKQNILVEVTCAGELLVTFTCISHPTCLAHPDCFPLSPWSPVCAGNAARKDTQGLSRPKAIRM